MPTTISPAKIHPMTGTVTLPAAAPAAPPTSADMTSAAVTSAAVTSAAVTSAAVTSAAPAPAFAPANSSGKSTDGGTGGGPDPSGTMIIPAATAIDPGVVVGSVEAHREFASSRSPLGSAVPVGCGAALAPYGLGEAADTGGFSTSGRMRSRSRMSRSRSFSGMSGFALTSASISRARLAAPSGEYGSRWTAMSPATARFPA